MDARQRWRLEVVGLAEVFAPAPELLPQRSQVDSVLVRAEPVELLRAPLKQRAETRVIVARMMVEGGRHLD